MVPRSMDGVDVWRWYSSRLCRVCLTPDAEVRHAAYWHRRIRISVGRQLRRVGGAFDSSLGRPPGINPSAGRPDPVSTADLARLAVTAVLVCLAALCVYLSWGGLRNLFRDDPDGLTIVYVLFGGFWLTLAAAAAWAAVRINWNGPGLTDTGIHPSFSGVRFLESLGSERDF